MKKFILMFSFLLSVYSTIAQSQQGYVKTKGRLGDNGMVIKGNSIQGVVVHVKDINPVVSNDKGKFSFYLPSRNYTLQSVRKKGYVMIDPDMLQKKYMYSSDPLIIVLEDSLQQKVDRREAKYKIRENLYQQYKAENNRLKNLLKEHKIIQTEYNRLKEQLDSLQDNNERLISEMTEHYISIDYDQLDDFYIRVNQLILNGKLTTADSLLKSRGDLSADIASFKQYKSINAQKHKEQVLRDSLEKRQLRELSERCYSLYEVYKNMYRTDSARYYLELRASLDTLNVDWQLNAGQFISDYGNPQKYGRLLHEERIVADSILFYYRRAFRAAISKYGEKNPIVATCYNKIAERYFAHGEWDVASGYFQKAIEIMILNYGKNSSEVADCYFCQGITFSDPVAPHGELNDKAYKSLEKALEIRLKLFGEKSLEVAECYKELGLVSWNEEYYKKALTIYRAILGETNAEIGVVYKYLGDSYCLLSNYQGRIAVQALMVSESVAGKEFEYFDSEFYDDFNTHLATALSYYEKAVSILNNIYDKDYPLIVNITESIEDIKSEMEVNEKYKNASLREREDD